jgi:molybdopterin/thiamine biosynthesis adenylyltransferase
VYLTTEYDCHNHCRFGNTEDIVRVVAWDIGTGSAIRADAGLAVTDVRTKGFVRDASGEWKEDRVSIVAIEDGLFSRVRGIFETDILADKTVFIPGVGSIGSWAAWELCKAGVTNQILMDHDRVEVVNVVRHLARICDIGRFKVDVVAEAIRGKNPFANVEVRDEKVAWGNQELVRSFVARSDLVICGADGHEGRVILNKVCVEEGKPIIFAGAFRRAYGGQVLFVHPRESLCLECFLEYLRRQSKDEEIPIDEGPSEVAYSDRPAPIEPGLSNDIAPISQMVVKLAIQQLLEGKATSLRSLDEDLVAPLYIWLNRREADTDYEQWGPLGCEIDGAHILRWYGVGFARNPGCPCCGDFSNAFAHHGDLDILEQSSAVLGGGRDGCR